MTINKKKIIFIASYPKSGNTWLRSIISSLIYNRKGKFSFDDLKNIFLFSQLANFNNIDGKEFNKDGNLNYKWVSKNWIKAQKLINNKKKEIVFYKTHSVRGIVSNNYFTDESVCKAFIYIIRDPRDVVVSLSKHAGVDINLALNDMLFNEKKMTLFKKVNELVSTWKNNVDSWMHFKNVPRLIIRYEDLINNIDASINQILEFLNNITDLNINNNINLLKSVKNSTSFKRLQLLEKKQKFSEATIHSKFFRKGISGGWKQVLNNNQLDQIINNLKEPMKQLNYL